MREEGCEAGRGKVRLRRGGEGGEAGRRDVRLQGCKEAGRRQGGEGGDWRREVRPHVSEDDGE